MMSQFKVTRMYNSFKPNGYPKSIVLWVILVRRKRWWWNQVILIQSCSYLYEAWETLLYPPLEEIKRCKIIMINLKILSWVWFWVLVFGFAFLLLFCLVRAFFSVFFPNFSVSFAVMCLSDFLFCIFICTKIVPYL